MAASAIYWLRQELATPYYGGRAAETFLEVPRGASSAQIAGLLVRHKILRHGLPFRIYLRWEGMERRIQAGEYRFGPAATPRQIAQSLVRGDVYFRSITIPEGLTAQETVALLAQNGLGDREAFEDVLSRTDGIRDLDPEASSLEGYLFPETYRFGRKDNPETIVRAMIDQFRKRMAHILRKSSLPAGWDIARIVKLASLIEKEVQRSEEGPLVASVLTNRLDRKMPLGCDATIIYAMKLAGTYQGRLGKADMRMESPYNSYLHRNLPPGPICNPGEHAIRAAMNPAKTDYLYYVARNDGTHQFSKDLRSHSRAVYLYQIAPARRRSSS